MKKQQLLLYLLSFVLIFSSCQKELSLESSKVQAQGTLRKDGLGDCLPKTVAGTYEEAVELQGNENYIEVEVNVLEAGSYTILTDTVNGIFFRASGLFTNTGLQTVRLPGSGTPVASGISNFVVQFDSTSCVIAVTILPAGGGVPAEITLDGDPNTCIDFTVAGAYITGTALNSSNTVTLKVNVVTIGTYNISTTLSNGITFSASGTVGTTGSQTIVLTGSGTPLITGPTNIPVTLGSSSCSFTIDVVGPAVYTIDCGTANVTGQYVADAELDASHNVIIDVNVTTIGGYNITGTINGMTFSAAGDFTSTGIQPVTLIANGIPANEGDFDVPLSGGTAACSFPVTVEPAGSNVSGTWQFTMGGTTYSGIINGLEIEQPTTDVPFYLFYFYGENAAGELFDMILADFNSNIVAGEEYNFAALTGNSGAFQFLYANSASSVSADPSTTTATLKATISSHNTTSNPKVLTGTFGGNVINDQDNSVRAITNGQFTVNYE
jgi:hypothetical protein